MKFAQPAVQSVVPKAPPKDTLSKNGSVNAEFVKDAPFNKGEPEDHVVLVVISPAFIVCVVAG